MKTPLHYLPPPFSNFAQPTPPLSTSNPLLFLLPCFFGWIGDRTTFDVLFYLKGITVPYVCRTFVSQYQKDLAVFHATMRQGY